MVEERETEDIGNGGIEVEVETEEKLFFPLLLRLRRVVSPGMDSFSGNGGKSWVEKPSSEVSSHLIVAEKVCSGDCIALTALLAPASSSSSHPILSAKLFLLQLFWVAGGWVARNTLPL